MPDAAASKKKKPASSPAAEAPKPAAQGERTLAIDIGGTGIKTMLLDAKRQAHHRPFAS